MDPNAAVALLGVGYKITCLLVGLAFGYMGYRLFLADKLKSAGNLEVQHEKWKVKLGRAAPGTFFSLFGAAIIVVTVYRGIEYEQKSNPTSAPKNIHLPANPPFEPDAPKEVVK